MVSNRRMPWGSLLGSREMYHPDIGKLDDCPHSIKPKYSHVLNIRDSDWICSGKLSKDWNGGGCILSNMRLTEESTDQLSESICAFCVLVNNSHLPESVKIVLYNQASTYLLLQRYLILIVFSCLLSNFKNPACSKILSGGKEKKHGGHKSIRLCGSIWCELLFGEREEPLMSPIWFS